MTQVVNIETNFADLGQMTEGLMERVHETHVILTGPEGIGEGQWVQFAVNLQDGTPALAGVGRCIRSVDNGEERDPHQRFDLVLDSLQFDQHGQDVYQYILMSRQAAMAGVQPANDAELAPAPQELDPADDAYVHSAEDENEEWATADSGELALEESSQTPTADVADASPQAPADLAMNKFVFQGGLPLPEVPPRPDLDPSLRVSPAPRPDSARFPSDIDGIDPYEQAQEEREKARDSHTNNSSLDWEDVGQSPAEDESKVS